MKNWGNKSKMFSLMGIGISLVSLYSAFEANKVASRAIEISKEANKIAEHSNRISQDNKEIVSDKSNFEKNQKSYEVIDEAYSDIYDNQQRLGIMNKIIHSQKINNQNDLVSLIDIFENLGSKYCKGLVNKEHIRASFTNSLIHICNNEDVDSILGGRKNATALLCHDFVPRSIFANNFKITTLGTCNLTD